MSDELSEILVGLGEEFQSADLCPDCELQELGSWEALGLDELVEIVREIDLHTRHTPKYTHRAIAAPGTFRERRRT
jgi:hypothetical protein